MRKLMGGLAAIQALMKLVSHGRAGSDPAHID